jgi:hypothetical protein
LRLRLDCARDPAAGDDTLRGRIGRAGEYLRLFRAGYEAALRGHLSTYCLFGAASRDPQNRARSEGWTRGQGEGYDIWNDELERALAARDRERLSTLLEGLGADRDRAVEQMLADEGVRER